MNDNYDDPQTGILYAILYLIKDAQINNMPNTMVSLLSALEAFIKDSDNKEKENASTIINLALAAIDMSPMEAKEFIEEIETAHVNEDYL